MSYTPNNKIRIVTAAALFDGHDAAINIMRRILQSKGAEIIHLGHNRSVHEIVECAIEEDAQGIAITSYQGGHVEFFKYMKDLLDQNGCGHIKIFGGGGGTILPQEIKELQDYGITRIYSPDDGRKMGLEGMIEDLLSRVDFSINGTEICDKPLVMDEARDIRTVARKITNAEAGASRFGGTKIDASKSGQMKAADKDSGFQSPPSYIPIISGAVRKAPVLGITGTGGAGKSSVTDEIVRRFLHSFTDKTLAVISVDPSKKKTGGALLGDRIRMNSISHPRAYMRSLATREDNIALSGAVQEAIVVCKNAGYDFIILESAGVGQSDASILDYCDISLYLMTPEYGAPSQLEKINMLDYADVVCINKFDKAGAMDALHDVRKQYKRNHGLWDAKDADLPVVGTIASQFNDAGVNELFEKLMWAVKNKSGIDFGEIEFHAHTTDTSSKAMIIPPKRVRYLSEIADEVRRYNQLSKEQAAIASSLYKLQGVMEMTQDGATLAELGKLKERFEKQLFPVCKKLVDEWEQTKARYKKEFYEYDVRGKIIKIPLFTESLSGTKLPKIAVPRYSDWGDILWWRVQENFPGKFPYTSGVFPLKREGEDPTRMFAGEGGPERTNKRFHYVSLGQPAIRLSTAFDSVTLYGEDPAHRPDIYGKVGNSGVSIATVDDAKKLYSGFDLCDPKTSVSMTINGPAAMLLAFFLNAAIDQQCEKWIETNQQWEEVKAYINKKFEHASIPSYYNPSHPERLPEGNSGLGLKLLGLSGDEVVPPDVYAALKEKALQQVRGTVQADILKEDQAQNTCIFSSEFALKLMGDVQQYFIDKQVRNFYSVSISGYHIAEAGANPISQLAFTLSNGFTFVEYYLSRGMNIDDFAPNLSFFFSNGMDPEYSVIGRVARKIWAKAMKLKYKGNDRSQKL
ncbi:MAG: methylmalonyl-CoA mutase family protein, partial [Chitinophagaceae bacterium]